ncbi:acyl carrier protein [Kitasatospora paranensis]|uniref:Acyl carrier protein n=1 Tax=Kitasatospora paranensis TaxID=258053 RepID=A0ABW2FZ19_9ACTN
MSVDTTTTAADATGTSPGGRPSGPGTEAAPRIETASAPGIGAGIGAGTGTDVAGVAGVVAIFRRVLETPDITPDSDFFLLGGDSLIATRVLSAIARSHGVELTFEDFLLAPTPQGLATAIAAAR